MKLHIFGIMMIMVGCSLASRAQKIKNGDVPSPVRQAFEKLYPGQNGAHWSKEENGFEASFTLNNAEQSITFSDNGALLESEAEIPVNQLPLAVATYVKSHYGNSRIKEASKITDASGIVTYEAEVGNTDLIFSADGEFLK